MADVTFAQPLIARIVHLTRSDGFWRLVDAYTPRVFGLFFHSYLITHFGAAHYALPGWVLGSFGLLLAALPDPHSYILVRANGARAARLYALTVPSVLIKLGIAAGIVIAWVAILASNDMVTAQGGLWVWVALAAIVYGGTEFLWAILGTVSLSTGRVRQVAQVGILARAISLLLLVALWRIGGVPLAMYLVLVSLPVAVAWVWVSPKSWRRRWAWRYFLHGVGTYAGWVQGISLITVALFQLPTLALGMWSGSEAGLVGFVAFGSRLLQAGFQPFQILQSVVIRDVSAAHRAGHSLERSSLWVLFKSGGAAFGVLCGIALITAFSLGHINRDDLVLGMAFSQGIAISIWFRHELAETLATRAARSIFLSGYVPVFAMTMLATPLCIALFGSGGLAFVVFLGWVFLSNSWRWVT